MRTLCILLAIFGIALCGPSVAQTSTTPTWQQTPEWRFVQHLYGALGDCELAKSKLDWEVTKNRDDIVKHAMDNTLPEADDVHDLPGFKDATGCPAEALKETFPMYKSLSKGDKSGVIKKLYVTWMSFIQSPKNRDAETAFNNAANELKLQLM